MTAEDLRQLGELSKISFPKALEVTVSFMSQLFDAKAMSGANKLCINSLRYRLAIHKNLPITKLPPCRATLTQHLKRTLWQIQEWMLACKANIESKDPLECGWVIENDKLLPVYFEGETAMQYLQKYFCSCGGTKTCESEKCPCVAANLPCSTVCQCSKKCSNNENTSQNILEGISEDDDYWNDF